MTGSPAFLFSFVLNWKVLRFGAALGFPASAACEDKQEMEGRG